MASNTFIYGLQEIMQADVDLNANTLKACLCMATDGSAHNNSCDTDAHDATVTNLSQINYLNRSDDGSYGGDETLGSVVVAVDDANNRLKLTCGNVIFSGLDGDGSDDYIGVLIYKFGTGDGDSIPLFWIEFSSPIVKEATQVTVPFSGLTDGVIIVT